MSAILELPSIKNRTKFLTVEAYHALGELGLISKRTELIEGVVIQKMPKSPEHATMVLRLLRYLESVISKSLHIRSEQPITLQRSEPEPDISIIKGSIEDFAKAHPKRAELVIEVSLTTLNEDREMSSIYAEANIPEYWLFNLNNNTVEVYTNPSSNRYSEMKTLSSNDSISPKFDPNLIINLKELFIS
ncbi:MAG: Uma2 family endonuclease [Leptospiraceae bacterium]|nr:Uma2 family endonuclease [Leptospiraceae bacterium]